MQTVFSEALLTRFRKKNNHDGARHEEPEADGASAGNDPDDVIDPDDSGPRLSVTLKQPVGEIYALPAAQPEQKGSKAPQSPLRAIAETVGTPAMPDLLDPVVLRTMPPQVAAFMLYESPEPPWRRQETLAQRAHRGMTEDCGLWVGE